MPSDRREPALAEFFVPAAQAREFGRELLAQQPFVGVRDLSYPFGDDAPAPATPGVEGMVITYDPRPADHERDRFAEAIRKVERGEADMWVRTSSDPEEWSRVILGERREHTTWEGLEVTYTIEIPPLLWQGDQA